MKHLGLGLLASGLLLAGCAGDGGIGLGDTPSATPSLTVSVSPSPSPSASPVTVVVTVTPSTDTGAIVAGCSSLTVQSYNACRDYLKFAVPARASYYQALGRQHNPAERASAEQAVTKWYTGAALAFVRSGPQHYDADIDHVDASATITVTSAQANTNLPTIQLSTTETWVVAAEGRSVLPTESNNAPHQVSLRLQSDHWVVYNYT